MSTEHEREALNRVERTLEDMAKSLSDVRERMARMEALAAHSAVAEVRQENLRLWAEIDALKAAQNTRDGHAQASKTWSEWVHRLAPWAFAVSLVVWNYFRPPM